MLAFGCAALCPAVTSKRPLYNAEQQTSSQTPILPLLLKMSVTKKWGFFSYKLGDTFS